MDFSMPPRKNKDAPSSRRSEPNQEQASTSPDVNEIEHDLKDLAPDIALLFHDRFSTLIGGRKKLLERSQKMGLDVRRYLSLDLVMQAFAHARAVEMRSKSMAQLATTPTGRGYKNAIRKLIEDDRHGDPYRQFSMLTKYEAWGSRDHKYFNKAALNRQAADALMRLVPATFAKILTSQDLSKAEETTLKKWYADHYKVPMSQLTTGILDDEHLLELGRATKFFDEFPPDPHGVRARKKKAEAAKSGLGGEVEREAPAPQKKFANEKSRSKKQLEVRIRAAEKRMQKSNPDFNWRDEFWKQTMSGARRTDQHRANIAVLMTTGCRPADLFNGVVVHQLKRKPGEDFDRLLVRISGSKLSDNSWAEAEHSSFWKRTEEDKAAIVELMQDEQVVTFNEKGQQWRILEIAAISDEAQWLGGYIQRTGSRQPGIGQLSKDEQAAYSEYLADISHTTVVRLTTTPQAGRQETHGDLQHKAETIFGQLVKRIGSKVFPRLGAQISPYLFRHAMSADFKTMTKPADIDGGEEAYADRAALLGHASGRTIARYGSATHKQRAGVSRGGQILRIKQATPVRNARKSIPTPPKPSM